VCEVVRLVVHGRVWVGGVRVEGWREGKGDEVWDRCGGLVVVSGLFCLLFVVRRTRRVFGVSVVIPRIR
jgi:hypothetical protein